MIPLYCMLTKQKAKRRPSDRISQYRIISFIMSWKLEVQQSMSGKKPRFGRAKSSTYIVRFRNSCARLVSKTPGSYGHASDCASTPVLFAITVSSDLNCATLDAGIVHVLEIDDIGGVCAIRCSEEHIALIVLEAFFDERASHIVEGYPRHVIPIT